MISFMKYNIDIMYRKDIVSCMRKNREKSVFYLTHYIYRYILKSHHIGCIQRIQQLSERSLLLVYSPRFIVDLKVYSNHR